MWGATSAAAPPKEPKEFTQASLESLEEQLHHVYAEKDLLQREIGVSVGRDVIALVRRLEEERRAADEVARAAEEREAAARAESERVAEEARKTAEEARKTAEEVRRADEEARAGEGADVHDKIGDFTTRIKLLSGTVSSMEEQLVALYAEKDVLAREAGVSRPDEIIERMRELGHLKERSARLEEQVYDLFSHRQILRRELGTADARDVVALFKRVANHIDAVQRDISQVRAAAAALAAVPEGADITTSAGDAGAASPAAAKRAAKPRGGGGALETETPMTTGAKETAGVGEGTEAAR